MTGILTTFIDGPLSPPESLRHFAVAEPPKVAWFAPQPIPQDPQDAPRMPDGWMAVGYDRPPDWPWPGQVRYDLQEWPAKLEDYVERLPAGVAELLEGGVTLATYRQSSELYQYVVYDRPRDMPESFVVRAWAVTAEGPRPLGALTAPDLEHARRHVPTGMFRLERAANDDPNIVETWT